MKLNNVTIARRISQFVKLHILLTLALISCLVYSDKLTSNFCHWHTNQSLNDSEWIENDTIRKFGGVCVSVMIEFTLDSPLFVELVSDLSLPPDETLQILQKWQPKIRSNGNGEKNITYLKDLLSIYPNDGNILFILGQEYFSQRRFAEASNVYETILLLSLEDTLYGHSDILVLLGISNQENLSSQWRVWTLNNIQLLEESMDVDRFSKPKIETYAKLQLGINAYRQQDFDLAKQFFSEVLKNDPNSYYGNLFLALIYEYEGRLSKTILHLDYALEARREWHWYQMLLFEKSVTLNMLVGNKNQTLEIVLVANRLFPENPKFISLREELTQ